MSTKALVEDYYDAHAEAEQRRLDEARLEYEVTKRIISTCITSLGVQNANIIDIGGGPGRYGTKVHQHTTRTPH
jgi:S-adenosylmethionine-dependent methyltransferase